MPFPSPSSHHSLHPNSKANITPPGNTLVVEYGTIEDSVPQFDPPNSGPGATQLGLQSEPIEALGGRRAALGLGMTVGGSSAVNGQFFDRGSRFDYDDWAKIGELGEERWDWEGIHPFFKKVSCLAFLYSMFDGERREEWMVGCVRV